MKRSLRAPDRKAQSLILLLFILIALIGVMALTLDFGFVLLARRQMQTGVSTAALEGGRFQDDYPPLTTLVPLLDDPSGCADLTDKEAVLACLRDEAGCESSDDACLRDYIRRKAARHLLRLNFDDDFDLRSNETTVGAGIDRSLIQGHGYRQTSIGSSDGTLEHVLDSRHEYIYRPDDFELNLHNAIHGDMLTGSYEESASHAEYSDYFREDFDPSGFGAFLIRMRRTRNPDGLDEEPAVSSRGGGLPLMLARAGWMRAEDESTDYSVRRDGVTVRATAMAQGTPALAIGRANAACDLRGVANFVLNSDFWVSDGWEESAIEGEESIEVTVSGTEIQHSGQNVGRLIDRTRSSVSVGERVSELGSSSGMESGFAPLFARVRCLGNETTEVDRVVAFGDIVSVSPAADDTYTVTRRRASIGSRNVSAVFLSADHLADPFCPVDMNHLMDQRRAVTVTDSAGEEREVLLRPFVVLAPALARTIR